ncbi:MAG: Rab family GTPase [Promethearchaeota archaeon]
MENTINLKIVVLGEGGVGKTSIIDSFLGKDIPSSYMPTIGSITNRKEYEIKTKGTTIKLNIWDLGGQRSFNPFNPAYYANIDMALLVFDLTRLKETLINIKSEFLEKIRQYSEEPLFIIAGNKSDIFSLDTSFKDTINEYLDEKDHFLLLSAKTTENINECFELLIHTYLQRAEILTPDRVEENTAEEFMKFIGKSEKDLKNKLVKLSALDSFLKNVEQTSPTNIDEPETTEDKELKYYEFIQQELHKAVQQKSDIFDQFLINLSELEKALKHLKKSKIKIIDGVTNNLKNLLTTSKNELEGKIKLIYKLNREENELAIISSRLRNKKPESNDEIFTNQNDLHNFN